MVLVVDDNIDAAQILTRLLNISGISANEVHDGMAALAAIARDKPSAVVLDLMMPEMTGQEVLRRLRSHPETRDLPVIIYSADWDANNAELACLGISDFISKGSCDFHRLVDVVNRCAQNQPPPA